MLFSLDVVRACKGDCLLLHYGSKDKPRLVLIDGGHYSVYVPHLKPRLEQIKKTRNLKQNKPLIIDLLMVSHVDEDHIQRILEFTKDLAEDDEQFAQILSFWHNSFEDVIEDDVPAEVKSTFTNKFGPASMDGELPDDMTLDVDEDEEVIVSSLKILASVKQGAQLRSRIINKLKAELNVDFDGEPIVARNGAEPIQIDNNLKFTVAGPMQPELDALRKKHKQWLESLRKSGKSPEDVLAAYADKAV